nr:hypothetical protein [Tranquillimonas rosea]
MAKTDPEPIRDPKADHLLTPENCVVVLIDYQPEQYQTVTSSPHEEIDLNVIALCKLVMAYDVPVVASRIGSSAKTEPIPAASISAPNIITMVRMRKAVDPSSWAEANHVRFIQAHQIMKKLHAKPVGPVCTAPAAMASARCPAAAPMAITAARSNISSNGVTPRDGALASRGVKRGKAGRNGVVGILTRTSPCAKAKPGHRGSPGGPSRSVDRRQSRLDAGAPVLEEGR